MKKAIPFLFAISMTFMSCDGDSDDVRECGTKVVSDLTRTLFVGPEGGCYYVNSNGNKSYVDRSDCNC